MGAGAAVTKPSPTAPTPWGARTFRVIPSGGDGTGFYPPESSQVGCKLSQGEGVIWGEATLYHQGDAEGGSQLVALVAAEVISPLALKGHLGCSSQQLQWSSFVPLRPTCKFWKQILWSPGGLFPWGHFHEEMRQTLADLMAASNAHISLLVAHVLSQLFGWSQQPPWWCDPERPLSLRCLSLIRARQRP